MENHTSSSHVTTNFRTLTNLCVLLFANTLSRSNSNHLTIQQLFHLSQLLVVSMIIYMNLVNIFLLLISMLQLHLVVCQILLVERILNHNLLVELSLLIICLAKYLATLTFNNNNNS